MAYGIYLAAVTNDQINTLKSGTADFIEKSEVSKIVMTTHYFVSNGTTIQSLDGIFIEAIGSGEQLNQYWHPLREPLFLKAEKVKDINTRLALAWKKVENSTDLQHLEYLKMDILPVMEFYDFASAYDKGVISFLTKPYDEERAVKVKFPVANI